MAGLTMFFYKSELLRRVLISTLGYFFGGVKTCYLMSLSRIFGDLIDTGRSFWVDL